eukprot:TRINITY_DN15176_c0_g1_i1.p1 TRINITY_DN15176_c0_g1~~TRINITY_DN15176_c0_g1_i1.p1  ORF type:complete len:786 (-),score=212.76 TRINITY_DN15176_c0_g1_i1:21-2378(-)
MAKKIDKRTRKYLAKEKKIQLKRKILKKPTHPKYLKKRSKGSGLHEDDSLRPDENLHTYEEDDVDDQNVPSLLEEDIDDHDVAGSEDDLDLEDDEIDETDGANNEDEDDNENDDVKKEISKHKKDLEKLKKEDPEFYKYLKANDSSLLDFKDDGGDDDDEDDDEDDGNEGEGADDGEDGGAGDDMGDDFDDNKGKKDKNEKGLVLTVEIFNEWEQTALKDGRIASLKKIAIAFRTACHVSDDNFRRQKREFSISNGHVFNRVMLFILNHFPNIIRKLFSVDEPQVRKNKNKNLPKHQLNKWTKYKQLIKSVIANMVHFVSHITEPTMISAFLRCTLRLCKFVASLDTIAFKFLRVLLRIWSATSDLSVRDLALVNIRELAITAAYPFIDNCLKGIFLTYVRNSKFINPQSIVNVEAMSDGVVELYGLDFSSSYQFAFAYIRQLAIHLKNSLANTTKDSHKNVYNWQFVNSLRLWGKFLCRYGSHPEIKHLLYPLIELILGSVKLLPSVRYYPLRFHCIRILLNIQAALGVFIPLPPLLLEILDRQEVQKKAKPSSAKPLDFSVLLKIPQNLIGTKSFQDCVISEVIRLLLEYYTIHSHSLSYPEMIVPTVNFLSRFKILCRNELFKRQISTLVEKLLSNRDYVLRERAKGDFSPKDVDQIKSFSESLKLKKSPLEVYQPIFLEKYNIVQKQIQSSLKKPKDEKVDESGDEDDEGDEGDDISDGGEEEGEGENDEEEEGGANIDEEDDIFERDDDEEFKSNKKGKKKNNKEKPKHNKGPLQKKKNQ